MKFLLFISFFLCTASSSFSGQMHDLGKTYLTQVLQQMYVGESAPVVGSDLLEKVVLPKHQDPVEEAKRVVQALFAQLSQIPFFRAANPRSPDKKEIYEGFGLSFAPLNSKVFDKAIQVLTGQLKAWSKDRIESFQQISRRGLAIGDVGAGFGLSTLFLVAQVAQEYEKNHWSFEKPVQIHLIEVNQEVLPVLNDLVKIINQAYPRYFHLEVHHQNVLELKQEQLFPTYDIVFALNLLHCFPLSQWRRLVNHLGVLSHEGGMLFWSANHYRDVLPGSTQESNFLYSMFDPSSDQPVWEKGFYPDFVIHLDKENKEKMIRLKNLEGLSPLKPEIDLVPYKKYSFEDLNLQFLRKFILRHRAYKKSFQAIQSKKNAFQSALQDDFFLSLYSSRLETGAFILEFQNFLFNHVTLSHQIASLLPEGQFQALWQKELAQHSEKTYPNHNLSLKAEAIFVKKKTPKEEKGFVKDSKSSDSRDNQPHSQEDK